jgi:hypothetical protein
MAVATPGAPAAELEGKALVEALQDGGYNIYFRHAPTDWGQHDRVEAAGDWTSCDPGGDAAAVVGGPCYRKAHRRR